MDNNPQMAVMTGQGNQGSGKNNFFSKKVIIGIVVLFLILISIGALVYLSKNGFVKIPLPQNFVPISAVTPAPQNTGTNISFGEFGLKKFTSVADFKDYLQKVGNRSNLSRFNTFSALPVSQSEGESLGGVPKSSVGLPAAGGGEADRFSQTNVQVKGIDEPDIVKTNGKDIYFSTHFRNIMPLGATASAINLLAQRNAVARPNNFGQTKIIHAYPPATLSATIGIDKQGELLLLKNILVIFSGQSILGYDLTNPTSPVEKWKIDLDKNNSLVTARLYQDKIYIVTSSYINNVMPCPLSVLSVKGMAVSVPCGDIYHPVGDSAVDTTYSIVSFDPLSGQVINKISLVGFAYSSVIYMSNEALYITHTYSKDMVEYMLGFYKDNGRDLLPKDTLDKLENLQKYDISNEAKLTEFYIILAKYQSSLSENDKLKFTNETTNRLKAYSTAHGREFEKTGVSKIKISDLSIVAMGSFPGQALNQFSLDEYQGNLRVATTVGGSTWDSSNSANDVYVLDKDLKIIGSILNLGLGEKVYSARFIGDQGYMVTFKQTDPFYVLDLKNPQKPVVSGQLKIPGYSSYLDPISQNRILGIGKEGSKVKLSLFDVSSPVSPTEADKYLLDEFYSEAINNHHAYLLDDKHKVFFLPGSRGGYVFSYEGDKLTLKKAISGMQVQRAVYIGDFMYILSADKLVVLNEKTWEIENQLSFTE